MYSMQFQNQKNLVAERVVQKRREKSLTQNELAARMQTQGANIDQQNISKIERNLRIVTAYELLCLSRALSVDVYWLLTGEEAHP